MRRLTYVIGDIHGRLDLLDEALMAIETHGGGHHHEIIALGDYIDRGPDSRGVIERLVQDAGALRMRCLMGNHEAMLLSAAAGQDRALLVRWLSNGGRETLMSYGWDGRTRPDLSILPRDHLRWVAGLPHLLRDEHRVYVHAGLRPDRTLANQKEADCLWTRERFLAAPPEQFDWHVVHGHTPEWRGKRIATEVEALPHRTNLDTGAYYSGVLAVGVFSTDTPGGPIEVLRVGGALPSLPDPGSPKVVPFR